MNDLNALDQNYWFASASLFVQLAFLIAAVWFALNFLKTLRIFQEQIDALLRLSITGVAADRSLPNAKGSRSLAEQSAYWLAPTESEPVASLQPAERGPSPITVARRKMLLWLQSPMTSTQPAPWRRIVTWLQSPAGS